VLTFIVDRIGLHYFGTNSAYIGTLDYLGHINVMANLNWKSFFGNILFLQTILVNTFGSNAPLWSLSNEFWYYVLFPVLLLMFYSKKMSTKLRFFLLALVIFYFIGIDMVQYFLIWLIGAMLFFVKKYLPRPSVRIKNLILLFGAVSFIVCFYELRTNGQSNLAKDFLSGVATGILCYAGLFSNMRSVILSKVVSFFSGISYSLYVIHLPLCIFITSLLAGTRKNWGIAWFLLYLFIAAVVFGLAIIFWYFFESRYIQVRAYIKSRIFSIKDAYTTN